jgi:hypothetical protein
MRSNRKPARPRLTYAERDAQKAREAGRRAYRNDPERFRRKSRENYHKRREAVIARVRAWKLSHMDRYLEARGAAAGLSISGLGLSRCLECGASLAQVCDAAKRRRKRRLIFCSKRCGRLGGKALRAASLSFIELLVTIQRGAPVEEIEQLADAWRALRAARRVIYEAHQGGATA